MLDVLRRLPTPAERALALLVVLAVGGFWLLSVLAGEQYPGYDLSTDTLSALAARDVDARLLGLAAGAALALAHAAAAALTARRGESRTALLFAAAAVAGLVLLALPISCPDGAAGCSGPLSGRGPQSTAAVLHRDAAVVYAALFVLAMLSLAARLRRSRPALAALFAGGAVLGVALAGQLRTGSLLGVWERGWLAANTMLLLALAAWTAGAPRGWPSPAVAARAAAYGGVAAMLALLPVAIEAQPAFDLRNDLISGLAARGSAAPALGQIVIGCLALAHAGLAVALLLRRWRAAAAAAAVAAVCLLGIALVQITCPRGAHGCSGPDSGRPAIKPLEDVLHRDLVGVLEVASVLAGVLVGWRLRHQLTGRVLLAVAALSPVLLWRQQYGEDIGWWQLSWLAATCALVLLQARATGAPPGRRVAATARLACTPGRPSPVRAGVHQP